MSSSAKRSLLAILVLVVLLIVLQFAMNLIGVRPGNLPFVATHVEPATAMRTPPPQPPMTASDTVAEQNKHPFSVLVSYVDSGFEPTTAHIETGQTVRFTNNSTGNLWVAASGGTLYPRTQNACGSSDFDSCRSLTPGQFWEFTFAKKGTWQFVNNLDKSKQGTIVVQ